MDKIIVHNPVVPLQLEPVPVKSKLRNDSRRLVITRRRRIECGPPVTWEENLDPTMRVARADNVVAANFVVFAWKEAIDIPRWNPDRPHHHRHGGRKVFAMARAFLKQK